MIALTFLDPLRNVENILWILLSIVNYLSIRVLSVWHFFLMRHWDAEHIAFHHFFIECSWMRRWCRILHWIERKPTLGQNASCIRRKTKMRRR